MTTFIIDTTLDTIWGAGATRAEAEREACAYAVTEGLTTDGWYALDIDADIESDMTPALRAALRRCIETMTCERGSRALDALSSFPWLAVR